MAFTSKYRLSGLGFVRSVCAVLFSAILAIALMPFGAALTGNSAQSDCVAHAEEVAAQGQAYTTYGLPITTMSQVRATEDVASLFTHSDTIDRGDVYLIVDLDFVWEDVSSAKTPSLFDFIAENASANMINYDVVNWLKHSDIPNLHLLVLGNASAADLDELLFRFLPLLKTDDSLIITNSETFLGEDPPEEKLNHYSTFVMKDTSDQGLLTSKNTRGQGLITSQNAIDALDALIKNPQRWPASLEIHPFSVLSSPDSIVKTLTHDAATASSLQASQPRFTMLFVGFLVIAMLASAALLFLEARFRPAVLAYLLPAARILWIVALAIPLASYLMVLQLPLNPDPEVCFDYFMFVVMEISLVCIIIALVFRWTISYFVILLATVVTLVVDQLLGGPLSAGTYLSYAPLENVRFFGIGNEGAALLFSSWIMLCAFWLTRRPMGTFTRRLREWLFPVLTLFIIVVIAAPWWGANFGVIIWGTVSGYICWRLFNGSHLRKREIVGIVVFACICAFCVLLMDTTFNGDSHMGGQVDFSSGVWFERLLEVFVNVGLLFWDTITFSPALAVLFVLLVVFLLILDLRPPATYKDFWEKHSDFHAAFNGLLAAALLMLLVEDSGILMPALLILYPLSGFIWLICNYHSWHIRSFLRSHGALER